MAWEAELQRPRSQAGAWERAQLWEAGLLDTESLVASVSSWTNHVRYGNTGGLRKAVLAGLPDELLTMIDEVD